MDSLWRQTAPHIPDDPSAPPKGSTVVVAGAGLTGLAVATILRRAGMRVAVVEARSIGAVTTGNTTGKLSLLQADVLTRIRAHAGDETLRAYVASNRAAQQWVQREFRSVPGVVAERRAVTYTSSTDGVPAIDREFSASQAAGIPVERLRRPSREELGVPFDIEAALRLDGQFQLHPLRLLAELARRLRGDGVPIVTGCRLTDADVDDHGVTVESTRGEVRCTTLVLATGAVPLDRGLLFATLVPSRSFVVAYDLAREASVPNGMFLSLDDPSRSMRWDDFGGTRVLTLGSGAHPTGRAERTSDLLSELDRWACSWWPGARRRTWWAAQDYRSVSHLPFAGVLPRTGGRIFAATGYDKWGMTNAIASALRIAGRILDRHEPWAAALDAHHAGMADIGEAVQANASVGSHLVADWVRTGVAPVRGDAPAEGHGYVVRRGMSPVAESTVAGVTRRVSGVCTHLGGIVSWNDAECTWDCPLHGSRFSSDGSVLEGPAVEHLSPAEE
ncbi:FAD-dependent oxidoreductase [Microbacterium sp. CPCC 204701]|uniref:FAD-dependent oxidoreductase n=1 Tax=Microbacterium sp. CPCC 204701 TaxID=2493084 RepID=UPI000FD947D3|nr:FAD-dependent oxidoreductase [Microbacterium sp. CPCC 204701]